MSKQYVPVTYSRPVKSKAATIKRSGTSILVSHEEYIQDVVATTAFSCITIPINPGVQTSFPWLSLLAAGYESYSIKSLVVEYEPRCATTTQGTVILAFDSDASDPAPPGKVQAMQYDPNIAIPPWQREGLRFKPEIQKISRHFVRFGNLAANQDIKLYDVCNLFLITQGFTSAGIQVGEIHFRYVIEFQTPQIDYDGYALQTSARISVTPADQVLFTTGTVIAGGAPITINTGPLTLAKVAGGGSSAATLTTSNQAMVFGGPGQYYFNVLIGSTGGITITAANVGIYTLGTVSLIYFGTPGNASYVNYNFICKVNSPGDAIALVTGATSTTWTSAGSSIRVSYYAYALN
ncbi:hypothetical protein 2 [Wenzhou tombus-like virus 15]|uniref:hypothetical protein 2 n=1 Tax=Wenzhou tombus-like virus 15 TaxID=1923668 RepID=UPI00090C5833|nr:hypothetical protein 2 [Wenzhou tombus-like virus 15]APG76628.1 hypothetical protein 2 [Wenzhou tombus-like virus 15]